MIFGRTPLDDATGATLVHSIRLPGLAMKKGRVLSADDVAALRVAGIDAVVAARLEDGDVPEDAAATRIAEAARGDNVTRQAAFTGRCNLYADAGGVAVIDRARVDELNLIDEAVTIATVEPFEIVEAGQMLATIKIIPFAAPAAAVEAAEKIAGDGMPLVRIAELKPHAAGIVLTRLPGTKDSVLDKTVKVLEARLSALGSSLKRQDRCDHDADAVAAAIKAQLDDGCDPVLIFGASAITDRRDEVPAGIVLAGGAVDHFGMPVDPGNLLLMGHHGEVPVVGLPGCARSPKLNGFDWVLTRLLADLPVSRQDIMRMGAGGLLKEISTRPQPRAGDAEVVVAAPRAPKVGALVLAAGQSRRMGAANKLLAEVEGEAMVARVVDTVLASQAGPVVVVTGHQPDTVQAALAGKDVGFAHNPDFAGGLSTSLAAGLGALPDDLDAVVVVLGDMPRIRPSHIDRLIAGFNPVEGRAICVPTFKGKRGNPVLWGRQFFAEMAQVAGDVGAKHLIGEHADQVAEVAMDDDAIFVDIDTPQALAKLRDGAA